MHNSNADVCEKAVDHEFVNIGGSPQNPMVGQEIQQILEFQFDKFPTPHSFQCWKNTIQESSDHLF